MSLRRGLAILQGVLWVGLLVSLVGNAVGWWHTSTESPWWDRLSGFAVGVALTMTSFTAAASISKYGCWQAPRARTQRWKAPILSWLLVAILAIVKLL